MKAKMLVFLFVLMTGATTISISISEEAVPNKMFTEQELSKYDGKDNRKAFVAIDGVVYDVTTFKKWAGGKHFGGAMAGKDLSNKIRKAPHGLSKLKILTKVGKLKK